MISLELESLIGVTVIVRAGLPPPHPPGHFTRLSKPSQKEWFPQRCDWKNPLEIAEEQVTVFKAENIGFENMNPSDPLIEYSEFLSSETWGPAVHAILVL